jgi:manganese oxidase
MDNSRRTFLRKSAFLGTGLFAASNAAAFQHEHHSEVQQAPSPQTMNSSSPGSVSVTTPDLTKLPWQLDNGIKVFRLTAEVVKQQILPDSSMMPGKTLDVWGYNGSAPGPTIEVNEGDRVRIVFENKLPEDTTIHWHGLEVPVEMDGTPYISQPPLRPGQTFIYEFTLHQSGTFFYHSHGAMQEMMGMIGLFIIHPKTAHQPAVQKDFGLILQEWAVLPSNTVPNSFAMEYNWLTINGKSAPATTPMIVRLGDRIRIRLVNMGMDHHPIHIHGNQFYVTGTEGGRIPETAWYPGNTVIVGVAQARDIEFDAVRAGDWMLHCHMPHHMMNQMVSMAGPMTQGGHGMQTGGGMEEGMGMVREGAATSENLGPALGRGMGVAADSERAVSDAVGPQQPAEHHHMQDMQSQQAAMDAGQEAKSRVPGYPQDEMMMMMNMDKEVARPETNGLPAGWSTSMQGMMSLIRVLPPDQYEKVMADIKAGHVEPPGHGNMPNMPNMEHHHHG